jgi:hypothetical protein
VVASLLLVLAGEVLAGAGLGGGRFLLLPASELQARRDAVLMALRTLAGTTEQTFGNDQWPWSLHGLREVLRAIETSGHLDLRALLEEPVLGKLMDDLIERAAQQDINGLRALGATADVVVERLHRLMLIIDNKVQPQAPAVMTFLKALQLFLDAFAASRSGYRILFVARAPIGFYGLGGIGGPDPATRRLLDLVIERGRLAELLDCYLGCECCSDDIICQIVLDKLLYDVDRAIDLYTLGSDPSGNGTPERRAVAFAALIETFLQAPINVFPRGGAVPKRVKCLEGDCFPGVVDITSALGRIVATLRQVFPPPFPLTKDDKALLTDELCMQQLADDRLEALIATLAPGCLSGQTVLETLSDLVKRTILIVDNQHGDCKDITIVPPPTTEDSLRLFKRLDSLWP